MREKTKRDDDSRDSTPSAHEEQEQYRGMLGDVCSNAASHDAHPELCGTEEPIVDEEGKPLRPERYNRKVTD
ncbi:MAG TPA: hypothetical protein VG871_21270 [Vicinamibacterales bacterium]|nr:hypothetical protein [Vicinamibacterales bacterium]